MATYFEGENLTDDAILSSELLRSMAVGMTAPRPVPKTLNLKDADNYDYYTRNVRFTYPGAAPGTTTIVPDVVLHHDTFDNFGKTGVFCGVPNWLVEALKSKLINQGVRPMFEDPGLASDDKHWWTRSGFVPAEEDKEYIFVVNEEDNEISEEPWKSFPEFFAAYGASGLANVTCSIKMTAKIPVALKGALTGQEEWRMGLTISKANVYDLTDVPKPRTQVAQKSVSGVRDKARGRLAAKQAQMQARS